MNKKALWIFNWIALYISGDSFFIWLLEPEKFYGGLQYIFLFLFPVILPLTLFVNWKIGCISCQTNGQCGIPQASIKKNNNEIDFLSGMNKMP